MKRDKLKRSPRILLCQVIIIDLGLLLLQRHIHLKKIEKKGESCIFSIRFITHTLLFWEDVLRSNLGCDRHLHGTSFTKNTCHLSTMQEYLIFRIRDPGSFEFFYPRTLERVLPNFRHLSSVNISQALTATSTIRDNLPTAKKPNHCMIR